jgi:hypothetical protein
MHRQPHLPTVITRRRLLALGGGLALSSLSPLFALAADKVEVVEVPATPLEAINQAGRLRMLSQRGAKLYAQLLKGVRVDDGRKRLTATLTAFGAHLQGLQRFCKSSGASEAAATYEQLAARWSDYRSLLAALPDSAGLNKVARLSDEVLALAHQGTGQLERFHGGAASRLVNLSGRQRMLSQRISKFYFFSANGLAGPEVNTGLAQARDEFLTAMKTLRAAPENTRDIAAWLDLGQSQWAFFDDALRSDARSDPAYRDSSVAVASENLLEVLDSVTGLYARL